MGMFLVWLMADRGRKIYETRCASCHEPLENKGRIGPDLRGLSAVSREGLLESVIYPNRVVDPEYVAYDLALQSGNRLYGRIGAETGNAIIVYTLDGGQTSVLRSDLVSAQSSGISLMPEGLVLGLSPQEIADLLTFVEAAVDQR